MANLTRDLDDEVRNAANAHTRLNAFYAVIAILEGVLPGGCERANRTASSIINQCQNAAQIQLTKYDAARDAIRASLPQSSAPDRGEG